LDYFLNLKTQTTEMFPFNIQPHSMCDHASSLFILVPSPIYIGLSSDTFYFIR